MFCCYRYSLPAGKAVRIELLLLEYSIEYLIEYSSTRWIPEVAINHRVVQNKVTPGYSFKFVVLQRFEMSQNYCIKLKN